MGSATFTWIAERVYSSDMPRSVAAVLGSLAADWPPLPGISTSRFTKLPPDLQCRVEDWPRVEWREAFRCDDGGTSRASVEAVLVPRGETVGAIDPIRHCAVEWPARNVVARQVVVPVTRWDDLLARPPVGRIQSLANVQSVGALYIIRPQP